jgi:hypothetical protein
MSKNILMIAFHCYRVYNKTKEYNNKKIYPVYEHILNTPLSLRKYRHRLYGYEKRLLHRTIRRPLSVIHRRLTKTPQIYSNITPPSISYPFARRRNDGGRARTAFALYGLPFRTPQIPESATISSCSSLVAKAFVH